MTVTGEIPCGPSRPGRPQAPGRVGRRHRLPPRVQTVSPREGDCHGRNRDRGEPRLSALSTLPPDSVRPLGFSGEQSVAVGTWSSSWRPSWTMVTLVGRTPDGDASAVIVSSASLRSRRRCHDCGDPSCSMRETKDRACRSSSPGGVARVRPSCLQARRVAHCAVMVRSSGERSKNLR